MNHTLINTRTGTRLVVSPRMVGTAWHLLSSDFLKAIGNAPDMSFNGFHELEVEGDTPISLTSCHGVILWTFPVCSAMENK